MIKEPDLEILKLEPHRLMEIEVVLFYDITMTLKKDICKNSLTYRQCLSSVHYLRGGDN
ncbi:15867_t:CDS:2 [Funneliformis geosporum]|nr:15867_t:CDS:2 [Funneliformis geosporum]